MIVSSRTDVPDTFSWQVDFCETGSSLRVVTTAGQVLAEMRLIPPALLVKLHKQLGEEIAKGARKSSAHTERTKTDWGAVHHQPTTETGVI